MSFSFKKLFHIHNWITIRETTYRQDGCVLIEEPAMRKCSKCGKIQIRYEQHVGSKFIEAIYEWRDVTTDKVKTLQTENP